jgi:hypothetical protein
VIPPNQLYSFRIPKLEAGEERDGFNGMKAAVDVVAYKVSLVGVALSTARLAADGVVPQRGIL